MLKKIGPFSFLLFLINFNTFSEYSLLQKALIKENYSAFKEAAKKELLETHSIHKRHKILNLLLLHNKKIYKIEQFFGEVLPFNSKDCLKNISIFNQCSRSQNFSFELKQNRQNQTLLVKFKGNSIFKYHSKSRTQISNPSITFGHTLHLIHHTQQSNFFFLLVREIEVIQKGPKKPLKQTINLFRVSEGKTCKLAEVKHTEREEFYEFITEFARSFGGELPCTDDHITL